ncbi:MAG TPA: preprotein translocase subunit SecE [Candidatus Mcinerneyibacteriales bacterium]|jgi:preprotein translocase subunit SecE|nr:preprotein translocase subunit SecE [Candidatus Mcinerneyibacteriales bacterium]HPQ89907.1 preprotein translocase subunit SecE [Candidatus Mcinerneyibacteriales bacterium]
MNKLKKFIDEVVAEMKKVVWPKKQVLWASTWLVIVITLVFGITLGLFDRLFIFLLGLVF